ncbi:MAG: methyltransferase domain-containing protein [Armatimonadota bacterium]|nr:methyltransferase domain-containing protein [Armatimonadota bacterium]MDR7428338.1 methyltransferase domain-containing protein [Armatimonadota bacterium]MDR7463208.1 methyltransferase domain-containing protein [Armatimonadota bacterium]MDR7538510.1 methyltransferase domain-containing protein [Armatimonadota bacterium]
MVPFSAMTALPPLPRAEIEELMDGPQPRALMDGCLRELAVLNRLLGVRGLVLRSLRRFVRPGDRALTIVEVASGGADLLRSFVLWGRRRGLRLHAVAIDRHPQAGAIAREWSAGIPEIAVLRGDARALPLADRSVDVALLATALHHLSPAGAVAALQELDRISRRGFVVTDLVRSRAAYLGAKLLARVLLRNPLTRVDGPRSVLRAYTADEVRALAADAGLQGARLTRHPLFRLALVKEATGATAG